MNETTTSSPTDTRTAYTDGLRRLADWLDANPQVDVPWTGSEYDPLQIGVWVAKEKLAAIVKALPGTVEKDYSADNVVRVNATFGDLHVSAYAGRSEVCERVVTGTETVTVPAVEAKPEHTEVREVVEWRCHPILADEAVSV
jgi:hypothetical protein